MHACIIACGIEIATHESMSHGASLGVLSIGWRQNLNYEPLIVKLLDTNRLDRMKSIGRFCEVRSDVGTVDLIYLPMYVATVLAYNQLCQQ